MTTAPLTGTTINHIALYVHDIKKSVAFYLSVMQFEPIPEPFKDGKHAWFQIGAHISLHIIEGASKVREQFIDSHLAFSVPDLEIFIANLHKLNVEYGSVLRGRRQFTIRPDGVRQIFMQDPDNHWIEVNDEKL